MKKVNQVGADSNLVEYYAKRAAEYERIYQKPERQKDLAALRKRLAKELAGEDVLEIACGTGYWTQAVAERAHSILATDINEEVLQIARAKTYPKGNVIFEKRDLFQLAGTTGRFTAGLAAFWWSHLKKSEIAGFLKHFHEALAPDAKVVFMDNNYVPGSSIPINRTDDEGNTYQSRTLEDGTEFEVLKNFPTEAELRQAVAGLAKNIRFLNLTHYWLLSYRKPKI